MQREKATIGQVQQLSSALIPWSSLLAQSHYSRFSLFAVITLNKVATNTELEDAEPLLRGEMLGYVPRSLC